MRQESSKAKPAGLLTGVCDGDGEVIARGRRRIATTTETEVNSSSSRMHTEDLCCLDCRKGQEVVGGVWYGVLMCERSQRRKKRKRERTKWACKERYRTYSQI